MTRLSTGQVADLFRIQVHRLDYLTRDRQIRPPKGPTGAFAWSYQNVKQAARLLGLAAPNEADFESVVESYGQ